MREEGGSLSHYSATLRGGSPDPYVFSVFPSCCHPERAQRVEGSRRANAPTATTTARFLDSLRSLGMTTLNTYPDPPRTASSGAVVLPDRDECDGLRGQCRKNRKEFGDCLQGDRHRA